MHSKSSSITSGRRLWPTPNVSEAEHPGSNHSHPGSQVNLISVVKSLAYTPTYSPSTEPTTPGCGSSQGDFLASLSVVPGSDGARKMTVTSGRKCSELLRRQDQLGFLLRTCLESSTWNSTVCFLTWKASATPHGRLLFRLVPSMPDIDETEFGLWLTPTVPRPHDSENTEGKDYPSQKQNHLARQVRLEWTPDAHCYKGGAENQRKKQLNGALNPTWVEWLMGYPEGWTDLKGLGIPSYRKSPRKS